MEKEGAGMVKTQARVKWTNELCETEQHLTSLLPPIYLEVRMLPGRLLERLALTRPYLA